MQKINKSLVAATLLLVILSNPIGWFTAEEKANVIYAHHGGVLIEDGCAFAESVEVFAGISAFGFALVPGFQPVAVAYGAGALGAKFYRWMKGCSR